MCKGFQDFIHVKELEKWIIRRRQLFSHISCYVNTTQDYTKTTFRTISYELAFNERKKIRTKLKTTTWIMSIQVTLFIHYIEANYLVTYPESVYHVKVRHTYKDITLFPNIPNELIIVQKYLNMKITLFHFIIIGKIYWYIICQDILITLGHLIMGGRYLTIQIMYLEIKTEILERSRNDTYTPINPVNKSSTPDFYHCFASGHPSPLIYTLTVTPSIYSCRNLIEIRIFSPCWVILLHLPLTRIASWLLKGSFIKYNNDILSHNKPM